MLLLDSEVISSVEHGPAERRDRVRALVIEMRSRGLPIATVAAVLAEVVRGRPADAEVFAGLRRERVEVHSVDSRIGVRRASSSAASVRSLNLLLMRSWWRTPTFEVAQ